MNRLVIGMTLLTLVSCGERTETIVGSPGTNGESCYSESVSGGVNVICGDDVNFIPNGQDGINGNDGADGQDGSDGSFDGYLEYVEVCPDVSGNYIETLLYLDGKYMAFISNGNWKKQRLAILKEGVLYKTTDGRNVGFSIINEEVICL